MIKKVCLKFHLLFLILICQSIGKTQELNVGGEVGMLALLKYDSPLLVVKADIEYKPKFAYFAVNTAPGVLIGASKKTLAIIPLNLKFIFGKKFRIAPSLGAFYITNKTWGYSIGLTFEKIIKEKYIPFFTCNFMGLSYIEKSYSLGQGTVSYYREWAPGLNLSCGLKYNFLSK